jgi:hypothetical protein
MRGFSDLPSRGQALSNFYGSQTWAKHREAANATMIDSDNVLLLHPFEDSEHVREDLSVNKGLLRVAIHHLGSVSTERFSVFWANTLYPILVEGGYSPFCPLMTAKVENNFPQLPLRNDPVFLWFMMFNDKNDEQEFSSWWTSRSGWRDQISPDLMPALMRKPEILRLSTNI